MKKINIAHHPSFVLNNDYSEWRNIKLQNIRKGAFSWNEAVASAIEKIMDEKGLIYEIMDNSWFVNLCNSIMSLKTPLHSDVIVSTISPYLKNDKLSARMFAFGAVFLSEDPEFMPTHKKKWPMFEYFVVEPGTMPSLSKEGLILLANPPGIEEEEQNFTGTPINRETYGRSPMISIEIDAKPLSKEYDGALLLNWSFRGRLGAHAKIFIDGLLDFPAFPVVSTDEDRTPNFWTVVPWKEKVVVDLKHVGEGYLWFEHCDIHHVIWKT